MNLITFGTYARSRFAEFFQYGIENIRTRIM